MNGDLELKRLQADFSRAWNTAIATGCPASFDQALAAEKDLARYRELSSDRRVADALGFAFSVQRIVVSALGPFPAAMVAVARAIQAMTNGWRQ